MSEFAKWTPPWVKSLGTAVWITDPEGRITYLNDRACGLLGCVIERSVGTPCHELVCAVGPAGEPVCRERCELLRRAERGEELEPKRMRLAGRARDGPWIRVQCIAITAPDGTGPFLVHCVTEGDQDLRTLDYIVRIASRSKDAGPAAPPPRSVLTPREFEILQRLARDEEPSRVAAKLFISVTTVRNHIQHVLSKMDVHSIEEAVALHLLLDDVGGFAGPSSPW